MYCHTLNKSNISSNLALSIEGYSISFHESIEAVKNEWNSHHNENLFLHSNFLKALEVAPPSGTSYRYGLVRRDETVVGILYFQLKVIDLYDSLRMDSYKASSFLNSIWHRTKCLLAKPLKAHVLVSGNMTLTGDNGSSFTIDIDDQTKAQLIHSAEEELVCELKRQKIKVRAILTKDFYTAQGAKFDNFGHLAFNVQPNMILKLDDSWSSFDDYLGAMKSKYRVRVKRARKKAQPLDRRTLTLEEIHAYSDDISRLYRNVADQASFNLFILPNNYFYSLQKHLGDKMNIVAYFRDDEMVGFYTNILNHGELDAHFLGYDPRCNKNCQLYLNMLYDLVEDALRLNVSSLILSRTAMEIKSSIGAEAHDMILYLKSTNKLINRGVRTGLNYFVPKTDWTPRSPFK